MRNKYAKECYKEIHRFLSSYSENFGEIINQKQVNALVQKIDETISTLPKHFYVIYNINERRITRSRNLHLLGYKDSDSPFDGFTLLNKLEAIPEEFTDQFMTIATAAYDVGKKNKVEPPSRKNKSSRTVSPRKSD